MIEMSGGEDRQYRLGYAGDTLNTAWYMRALLGQDWSVDYFTGLGEDRYSGDIRAFLDANHIGTSHIRTVPGRRPGLYLIHQEKGDRHFTYWRDTSAAKLLADDKEALASAVKGASMVYFSGITLAILAPRARGRLLGAIVKARDAGAKVVDATGAGDSFNGAYLSARLAGKSLQQAAEEGHRVAGVVIGQKGALVDPKLLAV